MLHAYSANLHAFFDAVGFDLTQQTTLAFRCIANTHTGLPTTIWNTA